MGILDEYDDLEEEKKKVRPLLRNSLERGLDATLSVVKDWFHKEVDIASKQLVTLQPAIALSKYSELEGRLMNMRTQFDEAISEVERIRREVEMKKAEEIGYDLLKELKIIPEREALYPLPFSEEQKTKGAIPATLKIFSLIGDFLQWEKELKEEYEEIDRMNKVSQLSKNGKLRS